MRIIVLFFIGLCYLPAGVTGQQADTINLDEQKVEAYVLPDALKLSSGKKIITPAAWIKNRRPQILSYYQQLVYGSMPGRPAGIHYRVNRVNDTALNGKAISKEVTVFFSAGTDAPGMTILLYLPKAAPKPAPVFIGLNFYGNQSTTYDTTVAITSRWVMNNEDASITDHKAGESSRGLQKARWPAEKLIEAGYGMATAYYGDLEPDYEEGWKTGVRATLSGELNKQPGEWSAIGAWAWGLSRMLDYLQTEPAVDARKVIVTGHSRLGKAALWAGANDTRFAAVIANNSGEGGAALFRRNFGETITRINMAFPHWFVQQFKQFNGRSGALPIDQHMLLSLIAPRPLYVASAEDDAWADPKGEFLSAYHASPVYQLFKKPGLGTGKMPALNQPVGHFVRYHIRTGKHDITAYDWEQYIKFADELVR